MDLDGRFSFLPRGPTCWAATASKKKNSRRGPACCAATASNNSRWTARPGGGSDDLLLCVPMGPDGEGCPQTAVVIPKDARMAYYSSQHISARLINHKPRSYPTTPLVSPPPKVTTKFPNYGTRFIFQQQVFPPAPPSGHYVPTSVPLLATLSTSWASADSLPAPCSMKIFYSASSRSSRAPSA